MSVKFIAFADLHVDIMFDAVRRVRAVIEAAEKERADFILNLGDIMYPPNDFLIKNGVALRKDKWFYCERDEEKREILALLNGCGIPVYHVMGNHDSDACPKGVFVDFMGMPHTFHSFEVNGYLFAALDTSEGPEPSISEGQLAWLEAEILSSGKPAILLSHHPLYEGGIENHDRVARFITRINADKKRVCLSINGHTHLDGMQYFAGVPCLDINSISCHWVGWEYRYARYDDATEKAYPYINCVVPYEEAVFACVTVSRGNASVKGTSGAFAEPCPYTLGMPESERHYICTAGITDREIPL
ncbi:MAG: metallophosphoesterase [Defluviitaleaceae bacterium]|nr:metallophosphoesterase [Defluviitaleaceae bacterium]